MVGDRQSESQNRKQVEGISRVLGLVGWYIPITYPRNTSLCLCTDDLRFLRFRDKIFLEHQLVNRRELGVSGFAFRLGGSGQWVQL